MSIVASAVSKQPCVSTINEYPLLLDPEPEYIKHRNIIFDRLKAENMEIINNKPNTKITVTLPDNSIREIIAWKTTPLEIARSISISLAKKVIIARVNGNLFDLERPLEESCKLELLEFDSCAESKAVFWHSSAHILGEACERHYGCHLCIGPPIEDGGFYYEMDIPKPRSSVVPTDYPLLEKLASKISQEKQPFERLLVQKSMLLEMFRHNPLKIRLINDKIIDSATVYRCGTLVDLCRGPHVPNTGYISAFAVLKSSSSYFLADPKNVSLQRIYGISFPDKKQLADHRKFLEDAAKCDHRKIGLQQGLFFFHELSPGSCFFLPHGAHIYNKLVEEQRKSYIKRGFSEVISPNIYNTKLWETSGHWENYRENMFSFEIENEKFALKPMNCPGHCLMFAHKTRSYAELPIRFADFGVLHRNEASGALTGLTRVRRFQQDDAHIFCTLDQIQEEMAGCLDFLKETYAVFGFNFDLCLSTRPENYLGEVEVWDNAEKCLKDSLDLSGYKWKLNPGDGAFYGPKIDITIRDALRRSHQCATIQLDFQLPERFDLSYRTSISTTLSELVITDKNEKKKIKTVDISKETNSQSEKEYAKQANIIEIEESNKENVNQKILKGDLSKPIIAGRCGTGTDEWRRPVMIHRAIFGSIERMIAILTEHFAGRWPFWLSPRQLIVVPVSLQFNKYAERVGSELHDAGYRTEVDLTHFTLNKKIRNAEIALWNFILVVGSEEQETNSVNLRNRDLIETKNKGEMIRVEDLKAKLIVLTNSKKIKNDL